MSEMKTFDLVKTLIKKVKWYDYVVFVIWIVLLYLSLDFGLTMLNEPGGWGGTPGMYGIAVFFAILIVGIAIRYGIYYLQKRRK